MSCRSVSPAGRGLPGLMATVNVALELHGAKQNLAFGFPGGVPGVAALKEVVARTFEQEAARLRPGHAVSVVVEDLELYDPVGRGWLAVAEGMPIPNGAQLYAFQPHTVDDQGRIPPARPAPALAALPSGVPPPARSGTPTLAATPGLARPHSFVSDAAPYGATMSPALPPSAPPQVPPQVPVERDVTPRSYPSHPPPVPRAPEALVPTAERFDATAATAAAAAAQAAAAAAAAAQQPASTPGLLRSQLIDTPALSAAHEVYAPRNPDAAPADARHHFPPPRRPVRVIVVIGVGPGGLGEGCARWLGQEVGRVSSPYDYVVVASGRQEQHLKRLKTEMRHVHFYAVDCTDPEGLAEFAEIVCRAHGRPNLVINAVGASVPPGGFFDTPREAFDEQVDVLVKGTANVCRTFLGVMGASAAHPIEEKGYEGVLVNMSSNWGRTAVAGHAALCAGKWSVEGLSKAIALELPPQLACIPFNPGVAVTRGLIALLGAEAAGKAAPVEEWADRAMPFLLSLSPKDNGRSLTCPGAPEHHFDNALQTAKPIWALGFN